MLGIVEIKCPKCKEWTTISNFPKEELDKKEKKAYTGKRKVVKVS
jgi:phage FluMu protein Com